MRILFVCFFVSLWTLPAGGQIIGIRLNSEKAVRKYRKFVTEIDGEMLVCGEFKEGIAFDKNGSVTLFGKKSIQLYVADAANPEKVPYRLVDGKRVPLKKKGYVTIMREHIRMPNYFVMVARDQTLFGLAGEYRLRQEAVAASEARVKKLEKASTAWFNAQRQIMARCDRLAKWLSAGVFKKAAKKWAQKAEKIRRRLKGDALSERKGKALKSVHAAANPDGLDEISHKGKRFNMKTVESMHIRLIYDTSIISDPRALQLCRLGEEIIEGFRRELVDPYADEFEDCIPDEMFVEFFFMHDDVELFEVYWRDFYGRTFTENRERHLKSTGQRAHNLRGMSYVHFSRFRKDGDHEGSIAHSLGHDLANVHFNKDGYQGTMDWLEEGCAYYVSFEFLGRNTVTCYQMKRDKYASKAGKEGLKTLQTGQRASFNALAVKAAVPLHALMKRELFQMQDADLAKSWSFFDYLARKQTDRIVPFLRIACAAAGSKQDFHSRVREEASGLFGLKDGVDVFSFLDKAWKNYARSGQRKDSGKSRRRGR